LAEQGAQVLPPVPRWISRKLTNFTNVGSEDSSNIGEDPNHRSSPLGISARHTQKLQT